MAKEDEKNEMREYEERIRREKLATERESWMEHQIIILETKERELELERQARGHMLISQHLISYPFKENPRTGSDFKISLRHRLIANQSVKQSN